MNFFTLLFASGDFQPHGFCYQWNSGLVWLNASSDLLIAAAYFTIPVTLAQFVRKRRDLPFSWMFALFALFIVACGTTHALEVWNLWHAQYWLAGVVKALTACASILAAILLTRVAPKAMALPSSQQWREANADLRKEVSERRVLEADLRANEARYRQTAELLNLTDDAILVRNLKNEIVYWNAGAEKLYAGNSKRPSERLCMTCFKRFFPRPWRKSMPP